MLLLVLMRENLVLESDSELQILCLCLFCFVLFVQSVSWLVLLLFCVLAMNWRGGD